MGIKMLSIKLKKYFFKIKTKTKTYIYIVLLFNLILFYIGKANPNNLLFKPLEANHLEARIGSFYEFEDNKLRLDIGNSFDFYKFDIDTNNKISIGADFFILSRLRSEGRMKFPVETADYFFGINSCSKFKIFDLDMASRLRLAHISSHLIDGYVNNNNEFLKSPFVYSREFIDIIFAFNEYKNLRPYIGGTYIFSTIPKDVKRFFLELGTDFDYNIYKFISIKGGYDFKLIGVKNNLYIGCNSVQTGVKLNISNNIGISFLYYYYVGYSIHGMFYNQKDNYNGLGFQINY